jgi:four helix bundle protein
MRTSVAANYRAVCRARSPAEFLVEIGTAVEEANETVFWLEFLAETGVVTAKRLQPLLDEANEVLAIVAASQRTNRARGSMSQ